MKPDFSINNEGRYNHIMIDLTKLEKETNAILKESYAKLLS